MSTFEKAELTASVHHVDRISKSGILIYNSEVQTRMAEKKKKNKDNYKALRVSRK